MLMLWRGCSYLQEVLVNDDIAEDALVITVEDQDGGGGDGDPDGEALAGAAQVLACHDG